MMMVVVRNEELVVGGAMEVFSPLLFAINTARFYTSTQSNSTARGGNTFIVKQALKKATMGKNKQISCKICYKTMRSNNMDRHMKVHVKRNETHPTTKRKYDDDEEYQPMIKNLAREDTRLPFSLKELLKL